MTGTQISNMDPSVTLPDGAVVPFVVPPGTVDFDPGLNYIYDLGADLLTRVSYSALAASDGAEKVGEQLDLPSTEASTQSDWNRDRISAMNWIDPADKPDIRDRTGADVGTALQASLTNAPDGATNYVPDGVYEFGTPLTSSKSTTLVGDPGRESADNSWDNGGGTELRYTGMTGDALTIQPPDSDVNRRSATLRDFCLIGNLPGGATSGDGIVLDGRTGYGQTFVKADVRNVGAGAFPERGFSITGAVYGGKFDSIFAERNGFNGFGTTETGAVIGEMVLSRVRTFSNGEEGSTDAEKANFFWSAGTMFADMISATSGFGPGAILAGGPIAVGHIQAESNVGDQIVLGQSGASFSGVILSALIAPGASYTGDCIHITADTSRTVLGNLFFADSLTGAGTHIKRDANAGQLVMLAAPRSATALTVDDNANTALGYLTHAFCQVFARLSTGGTNLTGDGTDVDFVCDDEILDAGGNYSTSTGVFTATYSGVYDVEWAIPLDQLEASHDRCSVFVVATSYSRQYFPGNVGAMRNANNRLTLTGTARVPMVGGDTLKIAFNVTGGPKVVDTIGGGSFGFLSITTAH